MLALLGALPVLDAWSPIANYAPLRFWGVYGFPLLAVAVLARMGMLSLLSSRYTHDGWSEAPGWLLGGLGSAGLAFAGALGIPLWLGFLVSYPALERARIDVATSGPWLEDRHIGIYPSYAGERPFADGTVAIYTEAGTVFYWGTSHGKRLPNSGSGFFYLPEGAKMPPYNRGAEGTLLGGWHWFTTD